MEYVLALGTNIEPRASNLRQALARIRKLEACELIAESMVYQSEPMYVTDQSRFLNAAILVRSGLHPQELLSLLKEIEHDMGRPAPGSDGYMRYGPRCIDIDIIFADNLCIDTPNLTIPHPRLSERPFVLKPLCDILPPTFTHPISHTPLTALCAQLDMSTCVRVIPLPNPIPLDRPIIMGIVNCTPDSVYNAVSAESAVALAERLIVEGADILDFGGESTRPGAAPVSAAEEIQRVIPVIQIIAKKFPGFPISIDTYRAATARAAIAAGAQIVNDVTGGLGDRNMLETVSEAGAYFVCMHISDAENMHAALNAVGTASARVAADLCLRVAAARYAGIPAWDISIDPGFGFGKNVHENWELVHAPPRVGSHPVVVGVSRKRFLRGTFDAASDEALKGTCAVVSKMRALGCEIFRVHDVACIREALNPKP